MRNGIASPRKPSALITGEIGSSSWPTPRVSPGNFSVVNGKRYETSLQSMARRGLLQRQTGSLNPTWVEWLMGFPIGHTDCGD